MHAYVDSTAYYIKSEKQVMVLVSMFYPKKGSCLKILITQVLLTPKQ